MCHWSLITLVSTATNALPADVRSRRSPTPRARPGFTIPRFLGPRYYIPVLGFVKLVSSEIYLITTITKKKQINDSVYCTRFLSNTISYLEIFLAEVYFKIRQKENSNCFPTCNHHEYSKGSPFETSSKISLK